MAEASAERRVYSDDRVIAHGTRVRDRTPPPYDIIGDVHGCIDELRELLERLGYIGGDAGRGTRDAEIGPSVSSPARPASRVPRPYTHPSGRTLVFLGDLNDRGPGNMAVWQLVLAGLEAETARFVPGNHDSKFARYLMGRKVQLTHGLAETVREFLALSEEERVRLGAAIGDLLAESPPYRIFDRGRLVVAHAGLEAHMFGKVSRQISIVARYGEPTGERTSFGAPIRRDWAATYRGKPFVVYGHTPVPEPLFRNHTINIDQGCVFGGALTALRYPELETVSVPARRLYYDRDAGRGTRDA